MIEFDEKAHIFLCDGQRIPSVTEILSPLQEEAFAAISPSVLKTAADRGTLVHETCEAIDYDLDYEDMVTPETAPYIDAYETFLTEYDCRWDGIEAQVSCEGKYAGIVDRFGTVDGVPCVLDIKTVNSPSVEQKVSVSIQLEAYDAAIKDTFPAFRETEFKHYALYLSKEGRYRLFDADEFAAKDGFSPADMRVDLISAYAAKASAKAKLNAIKEKHRRKK